MILTLNDKKTRAVFENHLISEFAVENIRVWEEVKTWTSHYPTMPIKSRVLTARHIFQGFIPMTAYLCVNISSKTRHELIQLFNLPGEELALKLNINTFDDVIKSVEHMMLGSYVRFQSSTKKKSSFITVKVSGNLG